MPYTSRLLEFPFMKRIDILIVFLLVNISAYSQTNIALGKYATASTTHPSANANSIIDGKISTAWNAGAYAPQWVLINLQGDYDISGIKLIPSLSPAGNTTQEILVTSDLSTWKSVDVFTIYTTEKSTIERKFSSPLKNIKGIKILTYNSPSWIAWYEIEVIGISSNMGNAVSVQNNNNDNSAKKVDKNVAIGKIKANSNKALWKLGNKLCFEASNGIICGSINQWNEDKSMAQIKIISSPGGTYEGEPLSQGTMIWVQSTGKGWHLCLDEELTESIAKNQNSSSNNSTSNKSSVPDGFNAGDVAKYAKSLAKKIMYSNVWMGNIHNESLKINSWVVYNRARDKKNFYNISIIVSWTEGQMLDQHNYKYEGCLLVDQFGCEPMFFITSKQETQLLGVGKRAEDLATDVIKRVNDICSEAKWSFGPDGCLGDE